MYNSNDQNCYSHNFVSKCLDNTKVSKYKYSAKKENSSKMKNTKLSGYKKTNYTKSYDSNQINNLNFRKRKKLSEKNSIQKKSMKRTMNSNVLTNESNIIISIYL